MKALQFFLISLAAGSTLATAPAFAQGASTGPGVMRCTVVIGRLSSPDLAERMPVLTWVQGYLTGVAATRSMRDTTAAAQVPEYDALQPRILTLCKADPRSDLFHVAERFISVASSDR
jgi:hypothetical protein